MTGFSLQTLHHSLVLFVILASCSATPSSGRVLEVFTTEPGEQYETQTIFQFSTR